MAQPTERPRRRMRFIPISAAAILLAGGMAWFGAWKWHEGGLPTSTPSCSWPLQVRGTASAAQVGLIRCYVRAVARHDLSGLQNLVLPDPPMRVTDTQLVHAADARAGIAVASFTQNPISSADASVRITYHDGASEVLPMQFANPQAVSWRLVIGDDAGHPARNAPSPAKAALSP